MTDLKSDLENNYRASGPKFIADGLLYELFIDDLLAIITAHDY